MTRGARRSPRAPAWIDVSRIGLRLFRTEVVLRTFPRASFGARLVLVLFFFHHSFKASSPPRLLAVDRLTAPDARA
jgi:hypothetical protein